MYDFYTHLYSSCDMRNNNLKGWLTLGGLILILFGIYYLLFLAVDFLDTFYIGKIILLYFIGVMLIIESRSVY
jgi:hypothetical protein